MASIHCLSFKEHVRILIHITESPSEGATSYKKALAFDTRHKQTVNWCFYSISSEEKDSPSVSTQKSYCTASFLILNPQTPSGLQERELKRVLWCIRNNTGLGLRETYKGFTNSLILSHPSGIKFRMVNKTGQTYGCHVSNDQLHWEQEGSKQANNFLYNWTNIFKNSQT